MSKVKANLIKVNLKAGNYELACKLALQNNKKPSGNVITEDAYDDVKSHLTPNQWAGYLSQLQQKGVYEPSRDPEYKGWGEVLEG